MSLNNIAACFLPYGFERQVDGTWVAFNREYFPLFVAVSADLEERFEKMASKLASIRRDKIGMIDMVWLYKDTISDRSAWNPDAFEDYILLLYGVAFVSVRLPSYQCIEDLWSTSPKAGGYTCLKWNRREPKKVNAPKKSVDLPKTPDGRVDFDAVLKFLKLLPQES